jgi:glutathione reductase (NADPH)
MWYTGDLAGHIRDSAEYGFNIPGGEPSFDWNRLKMKRDTYIKRLNRIYERNLDKDNVDYLVGTGTLVGPGQVRVDYNDGGESQILTTKHICIAVGGYPKLPKTIPGWEHAIDSDGFFKLETQPKRVAIVGAGYIGIEFAGIFNALGSHTHLFIRYDTFLRTFDPMIQEVPTKKATLLIPGIDERIRPRRDHNPH